MYFICWVYSGVFISIYTFIYQHMPPVIHKKGTIILKFIDMSKN